MPDKIEQTLGFNVSQALAALDQLDAKFAGFGQQLSSVATRISAFNVSSSGTVAALSKIAAQAESTAASLSKLGSKSISVDSMLGIGKVTEQVKNFQDAARLGTSTYGNALSVMDSQGKTVNKTLDDMNKRTQSVTLSWQTFARVMQTQALIRGFNMLRNAVQEAYASFHEFSKQVGEIQAINPERSFGQIAAEVRQLSDAFNQPISRVAEAQYQTISDQFVSLAQRTDILTAANKLAKITVSDLADTSQLLTGALNAYGESSEMAEFRAAQFFTTINLGRLRAGELGTALGRVQSIGHELGVSMEELQASLISITIGGVRSNEAATQLRGVLSALMKPTVEMSSAFQKMGVSSGTAAVATFELQGTLAKLWEISGKTVEGMSKFFPNIRGDAGALRMAAEGAQKYKEGLDALRSQNMATLAKPFEAFKATDAEKLNAELNKLKNFMTAEFGAKLVGQLNTVVQVLGGGNGLTGVLRMVTGELPLVAAGVAAVTIAMSRLALASEATTATVIGGFGKQATASILTSLTKIDWSIQNNIKSLASLRGAIGLIAGIELARGAGLMLGDKLDKWLTNADQVEEAIANLDKYVDVNKQKTQAVIRLKQGESDELMRLVRQQVAANSVEYLKDADNFGKAVKIQEKVMQTAFDRIMQGRQKLTQDLRAASEAAAKNAADVPDRQAQLRLQSGDLRFNQQAERFDAAGQYMMYLKRFREAEVEFARLQGAATDDRGQKLADAAKQRAESYLQLAQGAAKATGAENLKRQSEDLSIELLNKHDEALSKFQKTQDRVSRETAARANEAEKHNFELEADRLAIEAKYNAFTKDKNGELVRKSDSSLQKDLAEGDRMLEAFARKWAGFNQQDFLKNFAGDSKAFSEIKRQAMRQLEGFDIKQLTVSSSAISSMAKNLQDQLDRLTLKAPILGVLKGITKDDISSVGVDKFMTSAGDTLKKAIEQTAKREEFTKDAKNALELYRGSRESISKELLNPNPTPNLSNIGDKNWKSNMLDARSAVLMFLTTMDQLSQKTNITQEEMKKLSQAAGALGKDNAFKRALGIAGGANLEGEVTKMLAALKQWQTAQQGLKDNKPVDPAVQKQIENLKPALDGGANASQRMKDSLSSTSMLDYSALTAQINAAVDAMSRLAQAAYTVPSMQAAASGGMMRYLAGGGNVGTDTVPAMLSPGEFVVNAGATKKWYSQLVALNAGMQPAYRSQGGSTTNAGIVGDVTVNVNGGADKQVGRKIVREINREIRRGSSRLRN
jgi:TP901 family phage tail tape measure protein